MLRDRSIPIVRSGFSVISMELLAAALGTLTSESGRDPEFLTVG